MSTSPNLGILLLSQSQNNKYATANEATIALDEAIAGVLSIPMADTDQTPTEAQAMACMVIQCRGAMTADRHLILPNSTKLYVVHNLTTGGHNIIVETTAPTQTVSIPAAEDIVTNSLGAVWGTTGAQFVYCDGHGNFFAIN